MIEIRDPVTTAEIVEAAPAVDITVEQTALELETVGETVEIVLPVGPPGPQNLYVQEDAPADPPDTYLWVQTGLGGGADMTFWVEDGS